MSKTASDAEALTRLVLEVFRVNGELLSAGNRLTKPFGLTSARWQVLGAIDEEARPLTVSQIARRMGLARQGVQRIANDLNKLGLLSTSANLDHKRAPLFSLSAKGHEVMAQVNKAQADWSNSLVTDISSQDLTTALDLLRVVRKKSEELQHFTEKQGN